MLWTNRASNDIEFKDGACEGLEQSEKHAIGNWRKDYSCYVGAESLAKLCTSLSWKAELVNDVPGYTTEILKVLSGFSWCL